MVDAAVVRTAAARRAKTQPKPTTNARETGTLRGVGSSKPVPFVEDTE
tara:strand:+ start:69676 stop:69819 length:144 start_codon:yes stop_codon:yes gene_type:complete